MKFLQKNHNYENELKIMKKIQSNKIYDITEFYGKFHISLSDVD